MIVRNSIFKPEPEQNTKPKLTDFQKRLANRLMNVEFIIFGSGAESGHARAIADQLKNLRDLRNENPAEHDSLIASKDTYKKLYAMFPNWTDTKGAQKRYESMDDGFGITFSAAKQY